MSPYKLVYEKPCHLPVEIEHKAYWAINAYNLDIAKASDHHRLQLSELEEIHNDAYKSSNLYKDKLKAFHDRHFHKSFAPG
jgi:phenylacetate-coenzyme A ligase PaaK-like adenylate-forming protein